VPWNMSTDFRFDARAVIVLGGNDIASAVAHRLHSAGYPVLMLESPQPLTVRRGMAYASAIYQDEVTLDGITARHAHTLDEAARLLQRRVAIPVVGSSDPASLAAVRPSVIVDARLRKKERSASRVSDAPLVIGLGPGFRAGVEAHVVIETNRGPDLGRIITEGEADAYTGEPIEIAGHSKDRYCYAPVGGIFRTALNLGSAVASGQAVGAVDGKPVVAKLGGILRGIVKDGLSVAAGAKLADIDPRGDAQALTRISEKAWIIADSVLRVLRARATLHAIAP
jgi:xanthine dehydrogenase accessory factor